MSRRDFTIDPWRDSALNIAKMLNVLPEYLWPEAVLEIENSRTEIELSAREVDLLMSDDMRRRIEQSNDLEGYVLGMIDNVAKIAEEVLTDREKYVVDCHYYGNMTFSEIGDTIDLSRERVRQIEAKALRKMRHPSNVKRIYTGEIPRVSHAGMIITVNAKELENKMESKRKLDDSEMVAIAKILVGTLKKIDIENADFAIVRKEHKDTIGSLLEEAGNYRSMLDTGCAMPGQLTLPIIADMKRRLKETGTTIEIIKPEEMVDEETGEIVSE